MNAGLFGVVIYAVLIGIIYRLRIPTQSGRGFRFDPGWGSDLMPATIPK